jgi:LacI family transcriptional regulator
LCERFDVDRITVRKSLEMLVGDGLVEKKAGVGTMVKEFPLKTVPGADVKNILFVLPKSKNRVDRITEPFNTALFYGIEKECKARGYSLIYATLGADEEFSTIGNGNSISGVILVSRLTDRQYEDCKRLAIPAVVVNNYQDGFVCVDSDNEKGAYDAVKYLCQQKHRHIGIILGIEGIVVTCDRFNGYKRALTEANIDWRVQAIGRGDWTFGGGVAAMTGILRQANPRPTAIFAMNDLTAIGAMEAIKEEGLSVPGDISVIGFDNVEQCEYAHPRLSSVHVEIGMIAQAACSQLFDRINTGHTLAYRIVIPTRTVLRKSVSRPGR